MNDRPPATTPQRASLHEYRRRIDRAVRHIASNIDRPLTVDEAAEAACFSKYHFHRLFMAVMNESPGEYITRKKLERAAIRLVYANASVTTLAEDYGYSTVAAFSKAFNHWFGCRPTELKALGEGPGADNGKLQSRHGKTLRAEELFVPVAVPEDAQRRAEIGSRVTIRQVDGFELCYLTSSGGYEPDSVWETWRALRGHVGEMADLDACAWFAISHDHPGLTPAAQCRYDACVALPAGVEAPLPKVGVPGGFFAIYPVEGPEASLLGQYLELYTLWMPQSGYEPADFPVLERYLPDSRPGYLYAELWAKVHPLRFF
ncbi:AraC family transcriptional regulator [Thiohalorhabdus sp. Cl-TMA]|uniref:GyrI-like domain-containing protein n=1 Tax=Thiohalorhabdus methylotrophus TaxID=3242694 RepID=A0ABV4TYP9_9GAMM